MNFRLSKIFLLVLTVALLFSACNLDSQSAKERMAFNNFMEDMQGTQMMDGKVGNIRYTGNSFTFDFIDPDMSRDEMKDTLGKMMAFYANRNNRAVTGITILRATGNVGGRPILQVTYQAGPAHSIEELLRWRWLDEE